MKTRFFAALVIIAMFLTGCQSEHQHTWTEPTCTAPKTCNECGTIEGIPVDHDWSLLNGAMSCTICGKTVETPIIEDASVIEKSVTTLTSLSGVSFENEQAANDYLKFYEQNNAQNSASFIEDNGWLYGQAWDNIGNSQFVKVRTDGSDWTVLDTGFVCDIYIIDGYIYYMKTYAGDEDCGIYKMRASGEDKQLLVNTNGAMQIANGTIYYANNANYEYNEFDDGHIEVHPDFCHLYKCNLDGSSITEILSKPVFHFFVFDDRVLYQDDNDGCSLHMCDLDGNDDIQINNDFSYWPLYDGEYIFYVREAFAKNKPANKQIWKIKPDGSENQLVAPYSVSNGFLLSQNYVYFVYSEDSDRLYRINKDGSDLTLITQDTNISYPQLFTNTIKYTKYSEDYRYIENNYFCEYDGSGKWDFLNMED